MTLRLEVVDGRLVWRLDGRTTGATTLADFLAAFFGRLDHEALPEAIPEGVRFIRRRGDAVVLVLEERPQVRTVQWLADDSPEPVGPGAVYRTATLAFPYIVLVVAFSHGASTDVQQCFYRPAPLQILGDVLFRPNLLNVTAVETLPCWLCLKLKKDLAPLSWEEKVRAIRTHFWGAGFNRSAGPAGWAAMRDLDPRIASLEAWEKASKQDPLFPLTICWRPAGTTVGEVLEAMLAMIAPAPVPRSADELATLLVACPPAS
ncbi:MAG: hypothetical protein HY510_03000 [Acidobacteria bacterium]|nr:hypothetical protein [Acidobacteriota bacterium]